LHLELPHGPGVRVDGGVRAGFDVPVFYDSLLLKLIVHAADRDAAIRRVRTALDALVLIGPTTNATYLAAILDHAAFRAGDLSTGFLAAHFTDWAPGSAEEDRELALACALVSETAGGAATGSSGRLTQSSPWNTLRDVVTVNTGETPR
jgi:acetyl/propionyl-CoA carboxylase alpha subunit